MVLKLRHYAVVIKDHFKTNRQSEKRYYEYYKKKYLSSMVPFGKRQISVKQKFDNFINWYDEFTGMDEVRAAQKRVLEHEENFKKAQKDRRKVLNQLTEVQQKLKELYAELDTTNRGDDRYVLLVTQEHKLLKEEKLILEQFSQAEKIEREAFSSLSSSVKLSHEKERAQSERTKYWSIIGSILGTVIGILGSSINNHFKIQELKQLIKNSTNLQLIDCLNSYLETNDKIIEKYRENLESFDVQSFQKIEELLKSSNKMLSEVQGFIKKIEKRSEERTSKMALENKESHTVIVSSDSLEESLKKDNSQIKLLLITVVVISVLMPVISRYS